MQQTPNTAGTPTLSQLYNAFTETQALTTVCAYCIAASKSQSLCDYIRADRTLRELMRAAASDYVARFDTCDTCDPERTAILRRCVDAFLNAIG